MEKIVLIGAGGHCKVIIDIIKSRNQYDIIGVTDKIQNKKMVLDIPIIGDDSILEKLYKDEVKYAFICIGSLNNINLRSKLDDKLKKIGFSIPTLIHKNATVSKYARVGSGTCIMAGAIINPGAEIKENCIINTGCVIEHDCVVGYNTHISPKATIAGESLIGANCHIGIGSSIIQGLNIGNNVTIGAGAVVLNNLEDNVVAVGVPSKVIKRNSY